MASLGKRGKPLRGQSREIIYNVYKYFVTETDRFKKNEDENVSCYFKKVQERVANATGISRRTLNNILNEVSTETHSTEIKFSTPKKGRPKKQFRLHMDDFDYDVVRRMVYDFHLRFNELPTIKSLKAKLSEAINYNGSEKTLRKILHEMGFRFTKMEDNRKLLMEKHDVSLKRMEYLDKIRKFRESGKNIVYMDESYIHTSHTKGKSWSDDKKKGVKKPISKGQRLIIVHAGNEKGFVPGAFLTYKSTDTTGDYHNEMNNDNYEKWLVNQLIPNIPSDSVLVIDNAPYHNKYVERPPNSNTIKQEMIHWLNRHEIPVDPKLTKTQIYAIICQHKERHTEFSVDKVLAEHGHTVLRLPPYHPDFNPIENIWSQLKGYVASRNVGMNLTTVKTLLTEKVNMIGAEDWKKVCDHAIKCENEYRSIQHGLDNYTDRLVINTADSDSDIDLFESTDSEMEVIEN